MTDEQRHKLLGRILPTCFFRAIHHIEYFTAFIIGKCLLNAYVKLGLIAEELRHYIKPPKGVEQIQLTQNITNAMKRFDETGEGENNYIVLSSEFYNVITTFPMVKEPAKKIGVLVRAVLIKESKEFGISIERIDALVEESCKDNPHAQLIKYFRKQHQDREAQRKNKRDAAKLRQRKHRIASRDETENVLQHNQSPSSSEQRQCVTDEDVERVYNALREKHPKKSGDPQKIRKAARIALEYGEIEAEDLINAHAKFVEQSTIDGIEDRYIPELSKWLNERRWKDAPIQVKAKPVWISSGCGECGVEIA